MRFALRTSDPIIAPATDLAGRRRIRTAGAILFFMFLLVPLPLLAQRTFMVDDDGKQYPAGIVSLQQAIALATAGDTILVAPGVYPNTVNIIGHEKDRLKIMAVGTPDEVILQGDHKQRDGFHLEDVNEVLIQGFTIQDFGTSPQTATASGVGNNIYLLRANRNTIRQNRLTRSDMMGIMLTDSADNRIEDNLIWNDDPIKWGQ